MGRNESEISTERIVKPKTLVDCKDGQLIESELKRWVEKSIDDHDETLREEIKSVKKDIESKQQSKMSHWMSLAVTILPFAISGFIWMSSMSTRVSLVEHKQSEISEIKEDVKELKEEFIQVRIQLERISAKKED